MEMGVKNEVLDLLNTLRVTVGSRAGFAAMEEISANHVKNLQLDQLGEDDGLVFQTDNHEQMHCPCGGLANDRLLLQPLHWLGCGPVRAGRRGWPRAALPLSVAPFTVALETSHLYPLHSVTASHQAACIAFQPMGLGLCTMYAPPNGSTARWATEPRPKAPCGSASYQP